MTFMIGIDVGGTFTDLFVWARGGECRGFKTLSTPQDPSVGVIDGLRAVAEANHLTLRELAPMISTIVHGTTVTTNATLTRNGAKTGLVTTKGVRDALEMRRGVREEQYNNRLENVKPLVPRYLRLPVTGRLDYAGGELEPLSMDDLRAAAKTLRDENVGAVAVCFMNSFADPGHERAAVELLRAELPGVYLSVSSELLPTIRFYNRVSTTVLNAYVGPILSNYLESLTRKLREIGFRGTLLIMQSNGGVALPEVTKGRAAATLLSGPAGGPVAAAAFAGRDCIVADMGGTSFDASLVRDGAAAMVHESDIDRLRIALPMLDITTIGAGGGSIGWIDEGGLLRMGPQSAGALPGPACYGRGGTNPACTDANVVLGYLDPGWFAGGKLKLDAEAARGAIEREIAIPLSMTVEEAAAGMYRVINSNMAHGVREITIKRGLDPREFPLVVAGGAAAVHACMIASELEMPTLLVPSAASVLCAAGMVLSDLRHDYVRSLVSRLDQLEPSRLVADIDEMVAQGASELQSEGIGKDDRRFAAALDLRYLKQYHEVTLPVEIGDIRQRRFDRIKEAFHAEHNRLYGYDLAGQGTPLELINVRVLAFGRGEKPKLATIEQGKPSPKAALKGERRAFVPERGEFNELPVYDGHALKAGNRIIGPALIERFDTTVFVSADYRAEVDDHGGIMISLKGAANA